MATPEYRPGFRYCKTCEVYTHILQANCKQCQTPFPPKAVAKRQWTDEEIATCEKKKVCECGAVTPGYASKHCRACGKMFERKTKKPRSFFETATAVQPTTESELPKATKMVYSYPTGYKYPENFRNRHVPFPIETSPPKLKLAEGQTFPDDDTLREWAADVRQHYLNHGGYLRNSGIYALARQELNKDYRYKYNSDEMQCARLVIESLPDVVLKEVPA